MAQKLRKKTNRKQVVKKKAITTSLHARKDQTLNNLPKTRYVEAVGRRKTATARVRIYEGNGEFFVNNKLVGNYFQSIINAPTKYLKPLHLTETVGNFFISAKVSGSGIHAQLDAVLHGLARALDRYNANYHLILKKAGLLTRDSRMKETRKIGMGGKARRKRQSPKR